MVLSLGLFVIRKKGEVMESFDEEVMPLDTSMEPGAYRNTPEWEKIFTDHKQRIRKVKRRKGDKSDFTEMDVEKMAETADAVYMHNHASSEGVEGHPNQVICDNFEEGGKFSPESRVLEAVKAEQQDA